MIKNIVFDIGNVILEGSPKNALKKIDIFNKDKELLEKEIYNNKILELDLGYITLEEYYDSIKENIPDNLKDIAKEITLNSYKYRNINNRLVELIKELHNNYNVYILSDNNIRTYNYLKATELNNYINGWCISAMYHETKSNKKLYPIFFREFNILPEESLFIDDKIENIDSAKELGMNGYVFDDNLEKFLINHKII